MSPHEELFHRLLDESSSLLAAPEGAGISIPEDELHREIIVPLLPPMLADAAIRGHWNEQHATGFVARIARHFENGDLAPRWMPGDFEIHVTASYSAGPDARALADTLLSEESLREMTAALMNQLLDVLWPTLAPAPAEPVPVTEIPMAQIPATEIPEPVEAAIAERIASSAIPFAPVPEPAVETVPENFPFAIETELGEEIQPSQQPPSRALIRTLCRELPASAVRRGIAENRALQGASAAILARRILLRAEAAAEPSRPTSPPPRPRRASL